MMNPQQRVDADVTVIIVGIESITSSPYKMALVERDCLPFERLVEQTMAAVGDWGHRHDKRPDPFIMYKPNYLGDISTLAEMVAVEWSTQNPKYSANSTVELSNPENLFYFDITYFLHVKH